MLTRRRFLVMLGGGATAAALWPAPLPEAARAGHALGSTVSMSVCAPDPPRALDAAFRELDLVEDIMSLYRPSQLCALNRDGVLRNPHPYLMEVLRHSLELSRATDGAFDVTVQPIWEKRGTEHVDWKGLTIGADFVSLRSGQAVTLNGIAQGFALDRVTAVLRAHGATHALVDTGEIGAFGRARTVGIQHPANPDAYIDLARLEGRCLSTSGNYATRDHIVEPRTGRIPSHFQSVSIAAHTGIEADALSTAAFVLGLERGLELVRARGADALFVLPDGSLRATGGFPRA